MYGEIISPDITVMVDWAFEINYLSIYGEIIDCYHNIYI